ncbi:hypothetical protein B0H14DRAFT_3706371 [Mycena olivaceomarginata]|nr:hypothetical protein B0H14DRAFT_3706371 [Mycena olivaceomarginata]
MFSTLLSKALGIALLALIFGNHAHGSELTPYVPNDLVCPPNSYARLYAQQLRIHRPAAQVHEPYQVVFSTYRGMAGTVITNTTGTDNLPGAARSGPFGGATYNETLSFYRKRSDLLTWSYLGKGLTFTLPGHPTLTSLWLQRDVRIQSICGGQATYIDVLTFSCSDNQIANYDIWYTFHNSVFQEMAANLRAPVLAGDCPVNLEKESV